MPRALIPILIVLIGFVAIPPLLHEMFRPQLPAAQLTVHDRPRPLNDFSFADGSGRRLTLSRFRGSFVLVNVWATWCPPCKAEMASLNRLASDFAASDLRVVPISIDVSGPAGVQAYYDRQSLTKLGVFVDPPKNVMDALAVSGIPTTLLLDRDGREIARMVGPAQWDAPASLQRISEISGAKPVTPP